MDPTRFDRLVRALVESRRSWSSDRFVATGAPLTRRTFAALVAGTTVAIGLVAEDAAGKKRRKKRKKRNKSPVPPPPPPPPECPHACGFNEFCSGGLCVPACIGGAQPCPGVLGGCCLVGTVCRNGACISPTTFCANNGGNCGTTVCGAGQTATTNCASTITAEGQPFCVDFNKSNETGCGAECTSSDECDDGHVCLCHNNAPFCSCPGENGALKVAACFPASVACATAP